MSTPTFNLALVRSIAFLSVLPYVLAATKSSKSSKTKTSSIKVPKTKKATKGIKMGSLSKGAAIAIIVVIVVVVLIIAAIIAFVFIKRKRSMEKQRTENFVPASEVENKDYYDPADTTKDYHETFAAPPGPPPAADVYGAPPQPAPQGAAAGYYGSK